MISARCDRLPHLDLGMELVTDIKISDSGATAVLRGSRRRDFEMLPESLRRKSLVPLALLSL